MESEGLSSREVTSRLAKQWRELSVDEKLPFEEMYEKEKAEFDKQLREWKVSNKIKNSVGSSKKERPVGKPVKPKAAFFHYHMSERLSLEKGLSSREVMSRLAKQWREMPVEEKLPFEKRYEEEKSEFETRLDLWRISNETSGPDCGSDDVSKTKSEENIEG